LDKINIFRSYLRKDSNKLKKAVILFLALAVIISFTPLASAQVITSFQDVKGHWAVNEINNWVEDSLIKGYEDGTFRPDNPISRAEFVVLVNRAFDFEAKVDLNYKDIKGKEWFAEDVAIAKAAGYITGYEDNTFRPYNSITRQEAAVMIARVLNLAPCYDSDFINKFKDGSSIASWSRNYVSALLRIGKIDGYTDGTFQPKQPISRAEAVVILDRSLPDKDK